MPVEGTTCRLEMGFGDAQVRVGYQTSNLSDEALHSRVFAFMFDNTDTLESLALSCTACEGCSNVMLTGKRSISKLIIVADIVLIISGGSTAFKLYRQFAMLCQFIHQKSLMRSYQLIPNIDDKFQHSKN